MSFGEYDAIAVKFYASMHLRVSSIVSGVLLKILFILFT